MTDSLWMIYGANGYSGELIAREAARRGLTPTLAGRNAEVIEALGEELQLPVRVFALDELADHPEMIADQALVLHCAGPYSATAEPMMQACLKTATHYLDITGEISVFERGQALHSKAIESGIVVCPGVGFDVIPTDCIAATLSKQMPDATSLLLGFDSRSGFSPGTAKTSVEGLGLGGRIRQDGQLKTVPLAYEDRKIDFGDGEKLAVTIPWGDVSTAAWSTGIDNIRVFIPASPRLVGRMRKLNWIRPLLGMSWVQSMMKRRIEKSVQGPDETQRLASPTYVWGQVSNAAGEVLEARVTTANGYSVTMTGALAMTEHLLNNSSDPGYHTPTSLIGAALITTLPGCGPIQISS